MNPIEPGTVEVHRAFEAPLALVWQAWTEPEQFARWYGPQGFTVPTCMIDLRVGGRHLWSMESPDGRRMYFTGIYQEIVPMERLVFTDAMSDAEGNPLDPESMGMPQGAKTSMVVTVTFTHESGLTTVTVRHAGDERAAMGWEMAFDKLAAVLA